MGTGVATSVSTIPSKFDIIPIHTSDRAAFKRCRRQWNWSSPARQNLVRKVSVHGIYLPFWFGTGIHYAVEKYYDPSYTEDPTVAFETWYNLQVNGGLITENELSEFVDREPVSNGNGTYNVAGLSDLLDVFDYDKFQEHYEIGIGMMNYYKEYAEAHDTFTVLDVEHTFSVPILDDDGNAIYMYDTREMPEGWEPNFDVNMYGPLCKWEQENPHTGYAGDGPNIYLTKQVHARGRIDVICQDNESGRYGIRDYKTAGSINDDYFRHLDLDEQVTTYAFAAEQDAAMNDLPWKSIDFEDYVALLKAFPRPPSVTKRGFPLSLNRAEESTTPEYFSEAIDVLNIRKLFELDDKAQAYYTWLIQTNDTRFINTYRVRRNKFQKYNCGRRLYLESLDMLDPRVRIYPNPTKDYSCLNCIFRTPCTLMEDGTPGSAESLIADGFVKNYDR